MATVVSLLSLVGVWLVFTGAIYQATLELRAEVRARDIFEAGKKIPRPPPLSGWWMLLPPVHFALTRARILRARNAYFENLPTEELKTLIGFIDKAAGWQLVGFGGFLVAIQQTHQLAHEHAPEGHAVLAFVALVLVATTASALVVKVLLRRGDHYLKGR